MDKGIAITQRAILVWIDVEFTEGEEPEITDDKANNPIAERLVTKMLSYPVVESHPQGKFVRGKLLSQIFLDDDLLNLDTHVMAAAAEVAESEWNSRGKEEKVVCAAFWRRWSNEQLGWEDKVFVL